jgi:hypothetical protein
MSNYTKTTDFEAKDSLPTGDSGKIIRGSEFETEFDAISTAIATKADTAGPTFTGTLTFETISDGTIGVTAFVDEDDMSSDSATLVPTQQSVKAYVDAQVTAQDLDFQADSGGALSIDLDSETLTFTGGTGIDTSGLGNAVTFAIDSTVATLTGTQTLTNKTLTTPVISSISNTGTLTLPTSTDTLVGRATTDTLTNKTLTSPVISTISNTGTITLPTSTDTLVGRATTDTLTNKTLTSAVLNTGVSGTAVLDEDNMASNSATQLATQQSIKAYVDSQVGANNELSEVLSNGNTTGGTDIAVGTGDDITFADSSKAIFGAGSDLQIYHDGSNSYVTDAGTGDLRIRGANVEITGTVTADGLTVSTSGTNAEAYFDNGTQSYRLLNRSSDNAFSIFDNTASAFRLTTASNGDISFYEDTGTTAKLFWDASAESLGIGTSSPSDLMTIQSPASGGGNGITIKRNDNGTDQRVGAISFGNTVDSDLAQITVQTSSGNNGDGNLLFHTQPNGGSTTERMRIDSSGHVGIAHTDFTNYSGKLVVADGSVGGSSFIDIHNNNNNQFVKIGINNNTALIAYDNADEIAFGQMADLAGFKK